VEGSRTHSLGYDKGTNTWYSGSQSFNFYPGSTLRQIWKYDGNQGAVGSWVPAFTYTTPPTEADPSPQGYHTGLEVLNGHLLLSDIGSAQFYEYTPDGVLVNTYGRVRLVAIGLGFGAFEHLWVGDGHAIFELGQGTPPVLQNHPPEVGVTPEPVSLTLATQSSTTLAVPVSDPDGDALTCRWLLDGIEVGTPEPPAPDGACKLSLASVASLAPGEHTFTLQLSDGASLSAVQLTVTMANAAPYCIATGGGSYELGAAVSLGGQAGDADGDRLTYEWLGGDGSHGTGSVDADPTGAPVTLPPVTVHFSLGEHTLTLVVRDGINLPQSCSTTVTVRDTTAPTLSLSATPAVLWPPDRTMRSVAVQATSSDAGGVTLTASVASSEPADALGDGSTEPDWTEPVIDEAGAISLWLRAERSGSGPARTYTVIVTATDAAGNATTATIDVLVPHDRRSSTR
jgi:hypothetical protein